MPNSRYRTPGPAVRYPWAAPAVARWTRPMRPVHWQAAWEARRQNAACCGGSGRCSKFHPVFGKQAAAIRIVRCVARIDQAAAGLESRFIWIFIERIVDAHAHRVHGVDLVAQSQVQELDGAKALEHVAGGVAGIVR